jgi:hypothetical protein
MKKIIVSLLLFLAMILQIYAQDDPVTYYIDKCLSLLGKNVPEGFQRMNRTGYKNDEDIILMVENGIVVLSMFGTTFDRNNEAAEFNALFYDYFENNNWNFYDSTYDGSDVYVKNGIYAYIFNPTKRDDGLIVSMIGFSRNIDNF